MIGNIDGDLVAFRCSASVEPNGEEEIAILRCDRLMQELLHYTGVDSYNCFLTGANNYRKIINPEYKANRKDKEPPRFLQQCREFLVKEWNAVISDGCEADDLLGIAQYKEETICISLDKDLLMIPGWHYNWLHNEKTFTTPLDGLRKFYKQMLIGDVSDNIVGVWKVGKVKASKYLDDLTEENDMIQQVLDLYNNDYTRFVMNAQCLWILQKEGETWANRTKELTLPALLQQEVDQMLNSMKFMMGDISMEPIMNHQKTSGILVNGEETVFMEIDTLP